MCCVCVLCVCVCVCCDTGYGGPHAGFFAVRKELIKLIPGRIVGETRCVLCVYVSMHACMFV